MERELLSFPSALQKERLKFQPVLPSDLCGENIEATFGATTSSARDQERIKAIFPNLYGKRIVHLKPSKTKSSDALKSMRIGVVLSGGQAAGGHNCICALFDYINTEKAKASSSNAEDFQLLGFKNGPKGIFTGDFVVLTSEIIDRYRNTGGFDMIGSGRDKIHVSAH